MWRKEFLGLRGMLREPAWLLLYGRRKTGKSFMTRLLISWDLYVTVTRDGEAVLEERGGEPKRVGVERAISLVSDLLSRGQIVVVDEFQRLPESLWDMLAISHPEGTLILVASSLGVIERVFARHSPLLGLVAPLRIDIISMSDAVASLTPRLGPRRAILWGLMLREPWLTAIPGILGPEPWDWVASNAHLAYSIASSLVGEVFSEEERRLTRLYDAVLRLLGTGVWDSRSLANILYQRGLIEAPSPSTVTGILDKLAAMGLVAKTRLWMTRGKRIYYRHASPLLGMIYGLVERDAIDEYPVAPGSLREDALSLYSRELQFSLAELLAEHWGGVPSYTILPRGEGDVDIVVLDKKGRRAIAAYELKLGTCGRRDFVKALERAKRVGAEKPGIICLSGSSGAAPQGLEVLGPEDIAEIALGNVRKSTRRARESYSFSE